MNGFAPFFLMPAAGFQEVMVLPGERTCSVLGALSHPLAQPASQVNGYAPFFDAFLPN